MRLALGGDTGIPGRFVGYTEHLELQAMVEAGLTPLEAVTAAAATPASILGLTDLGTLAPGKSADFLVLDANPLNDIKNTLRINDVYREGTRLIVPRGAQPGNNRPRLASNSFTKSLSAPSAFGF